MPHKALQFAIALLAYGTGCYLTGVTENSAVELIAAFLLFVLAVTLFDIRLTPGPLTVIGLTLLLWIPVVLFVFSQLPLNETCMPYIPEQRIPRQEPAMREKSEVPTYGREGQRPRPATTLPEEHSKAFAEGVPTFSKPYLPGR
jgi:hypothetical protein